MDKSPPPPGKTPSQLIDARIEALGDWRGVRRARLQGADQGGGSSQHRGPCVDGALAARHLPAERAGENALRLRALATLPATRGIP